MNKQENILDNPNFKHNPFQVPEDYFETNYLKISEKVLSSQSQNPFAIPEDYFETNVLKITEKILSDKSKASFDVPENYFESNALKLSDKILALEQQENSRALQKSLSNNKYQKKIIYFSVVKYIAAAASIIGIIWGVYVYYMTEPVVKNDIIQKPCQTIACLTKQDILSKVQLLDDEVIEGAVSDEAIDEYFNQNNSFSKDTNSSLIDEAF